MILRTSRISEDFFVVIVCCIVKSLVEGKIFTCQKKAGSQRILPKVGAV
jgi:hypothetical protein